MVIIVIGVLLFKVYFTLNIYVTAKSSNDVLQVVSIWFVIYLAEEKDRIAIRTVNTFSRGLLRE